MATVQNIKPDAASIVDAIAMIPPMPQSAQQVLAQFGDEFIDANQVVAVIEKDPAVCAKLLGLANSAYFGQAETVTSVEVAVVRVLGVDTVRSLVFAMAVQGTFDRKRCPAFNAERFWYNAIAVAECCKKLVSKADKTPEDQRSLAYPTGLCHNLGLLALIHIEPERADRVLRFYAEPTNTRTLEVLMQREFHTDHIRATAEIARHWNLPEPILTAYDGRGAGNINDEHRLSTSLQAAAVAVGYTDRLEAIRTELAPIANSVGISVDALQEIAIPTEKQENRLRSIASTMSA